MIQDIRKLLNSMFIGREAEIDSLLLGYLTGTNVFLLGKPGTGKTALADTFTSLINGKLFSYLMTKETSQSELFGPFSIKQYKDEDRYVRIRKGTLLEADIAFLDETFKCNSSTLNSLLNVMNEHKYREEGNVYDIPLRMVIGASNELPDGPELNALYDRFLLRHEVRSLEFDERKELHRQRGDGTLQASIATECDSIIHATKSGINAARESFIKVVPSSIPADIMQKYWEISSALKFQHGIEISERRDLQICMLMKANSTLNGRLEVTNDDLSILQHTAWTRPEQRQAITDVVIAIASPGLVELRKLQDAMLEIKNRVNRAESTHGIKDEEFLAINKDKNDIISRVSELRDAAATVEGKKIFEKIATHGKEVNEKIAARFGV